MSSVPAVSEEQEQTVDRVIAAVIAAIDAGQRVDPCEWVERYPEFATDLAEFFADLETIGEQFRKTGASDPAPTASFAFGEDPTDRATATTVDLRPQPAQVPRVGALAFGRCYTLLKRIGGGGQGNVWKAFQSHPNRLVAIKIVKGGYLASSEEVRRFRDETEIISRLDHPHIIPIYEVGEHGGHHYFSMKLMSGGSLADRLAAYRNRPELAADLIIEIAETLQHAHKHGVIHRDLKPSNIMFDAEGRPYLTDFGLAKRYGEDVEATESGSIVGTAAYMSPEQASGKKGVVTTASDVYGLGATLYTMLTGCPPFAGDSVLEILDRVRECPPASPSKVNPKVPRDLAAACEKCLEKAPADRYESALELAEDLRRWRQGKPTVARPVGPLERAGKWCRRRPGLAAALAAIVLVAAMGVIGVAWQLQKTQRAYALEKRAYALAASTNYFYRIALAAEAWNDHDFARACALLEKCDTGRRGWEWFHLMGLRHRPPLPVKASDRKIFSVAFSPDGQYLASGSHNSLCIWDAATGRLVHTFGGDKDHQEMARCVAFSPDGRRLAAARWDGMIKIWDIETGNLACEPLVGHMGRVMSVAYNPDGRFLASAGADGDVRIWDTESGLTILTSHAHDSVILSLAYSPDGQLIASASDDGVVKLWSSKARQPSWTSREKFESVTDLGFSPDGQRLALAIESGAVMVLDTQTGQLVLPIPGSHTDAVRGIAFSADGKRIASGSRDGTVKLWDASTGQEAIALRATPNGVVWDVAFSPNPALERLAAGYEDGSIYIWEAPRDTSTQDPLQVLTGHEGVVYGVSCSDDGRHVATAGGDGSIRIWEVETGLTERTLSGHTGQVYTVAYSPNGQFLASAGADKVVRIWDALSGQQVRTLPGHTDDVWCVAYSPDGRFLASADGAGQIRLCDITAGWRIRPMAVEAADEEVWCAAFSPDSKRLAIGCTSGKIKVWDVEPGRPKPDFEWKAHRDRVRNLAFSGDGRLASAGADGLVTIWDPQTGIPRLPFPGSERSGSVTFSPDGRFLVAGVADGTVRFWEARLNQPMPPVILYGHTSRVLTVAFSPNGQRLVSGGFDSTARVWDTTGWGRR